MRKHEEENVTMKKKLRKYDENETRVFDFMKLF